MGSGAPPTYAGDVAIGSLVQRLEHAVDVFKTTIFLFSASLNFDLRILDIRNMIDRVKKVVPWLIVNSGP